MRADALCLDRATSAASIGDSSLRPLPLTAVACSRSSIGEPLCRVPSSRTPFCRSLAPTMSFMTGTAYSWLFHFSLFKNRWQRNAVTATCGVRSFACFAVNQVKSCQARHFVHARSETTPTGRADHGTVTPEALPSRRGRVPTSNDASTLPRTALPWSRKARATSALSFVAWRSDTTPNARKVPRLAAVSPRRPKPSVPTCAPLPRFRPRSADQPTRRGTTLAQSEALPRLAVEVSSVYESWRLALSRIGYPHRDRPRSR